MLPIKFCEMPQNWLLSSSSILLLFRIVIGFLNPFLLHSVHQQFDFEKVQHVHGILFCWFGTLSEIHWKLIVLGNIFWIFLLSFFGRKIRNVLNPLWGDNKERFLYAHGDLKALVQRGVSDRGKKWCGDASRGHVFVRTYQLTF